ncbi:hypothetical protein SARC_05596 [Sphaeroforma arctica JP610]|uniref:Folliculin-interacting protein C-terminal domain-containing protein n=1 Tax=Sphaeroforma arctica JP610 TaxID=667725 RepID=A0A0L0FZ59_9EUKA|nr:hypothetical protein SARC_05596 [Sphaeroforma arctica JP610]KNC82107.1 hypothetical protein SARC_05596 [Sphaeroforma arctica JP610]|eukprot:XP_014156009.1 hypothetical protein SARC_05596 [Sphaeroforma arctica JP610]
MGDFMYQGDLWQLADTAWGETQGMVYKRLFGFLVLHWLVTPICITLPAPTGVYLPLLGMGAAIGRLFGELIHTKFPSIHRGGYAVVGAAAMGGGGTRTISSAMVLCEDSVIEEPVSHAVGVIADSKSYEVTVLSTRPDLDVDPHLLSDVEVASHIDTTTAKPSALITFMLQAVTDMWNLGLPSETCLWHLEDHLQNVYFKSKVLAEVMADLKAQGQPITKASLATAIGVDATDIALLLTVMDTYINNSPAR